MAYNLLIDRVYLGYNPLILTFDPTPPKINMEHNNGGLEDDFPFELGDF